MDCVKVPLNISYNNNNKKIGIYAPNKGADKEKKISGYPWYMLNNDDEHIEQLIKNFKGKPNGYFYGIQNKYIVIDTDTKEGYKIVKKWLKENHLNPSFTKSFSWSEEKNYKYHYWFCVNNNNLLYLSSKINNNIGVDIITDKIVERNIINDEYFGRVELQIQHFYKLIDILGYDKKEILEQKYFLNPSNYKDFKLIDKNEPKNEIKNDIKNDIKINDYKFVSSLLKILDCDYYEDYEKWRNIGFCLHSLIKLGYDENKIYMMYVKFSKQWDKYNVNELNKFWYSIKDVNNGLSLGTLCLYAKESDEEEYENIKKKYGKVKETKKNNDNFKDDEELNLLIKMNDNEIARYIYENNKDKYRYIQYEKQGAWIYYDEYNKMIIGDKPKDLYLFLSDFLVERINNKIDMIKQNITNSTDLEYYNKMLNKSIIKANKISFRKSLTADLMELYTDNKILDKIDNNKFLFAFNNCLYDFKQKKIRNIMPDDYIMLNTGYNYNYDENLNEEETFIYKTILSLFETKEEADYVINIIAHSMLSNFKEVIYIHTGIGRNGKSLLLNFVAKCFGNYSISAEKTIFSVKRNGDEKDPTLAKSKSRKLMIVSEPDDNHPIDIEKMKQVSGNDTITCRDLFKSTIHYDPFFTCHIVCNEKPKLSKCDMAIEKRMKVINYPFTFTDKPINETQKLLNTGLKDNLNNEKNYIEFMTILINRLKKIISVDDKNNIVDEKIIIPSRFVDETTEYMEESNPVKQFIDKYYIITDDDKDRIEKNEFIKHYNDLALIRLSSQRIGSYLTTTKIQVKKAKINNTAQWCLIRLKKKQIDEGLDDI